MNELKPYKMSNKELFRVYLHYIWCSIKNWNPGGFMWPNSSLSYYSSDRYKVARCSCGFGFKYHPLACKNDDFKFKYNIPKNNLGLLQNPGYTRLFGFSGEGEGYEKKKEKI